MKQFRKAILVVMLSLCSVLSYADQYDKDYLTITESYINTTSSITPQLVEHAATIFGTDYDLTITNIVLGQYWFSCDIIIESFDGFPRDLIVEQSADVEFPQGQAINPGTISTISEPSTVQGYDLFVHSEVRLYNDGIEKTVTVTYHFINTYQNDDYYLVVSFPYNQHTWTGINNVEITPTSVEYYDLMGRKLNGPQPGIVIEKQGNKTTKKLYR